MIARRSAATKPADHEQKSLEPFDWEGVEEKLRAGPGPCWLSVTDNGASHVRPVFAAWTGDSFVFASNPSARKTACLESAPRVSIAVDLGDVHLVVEGQAVRLTRVDDLGRACRALMDVFGWPTEVVGDQLDADYAAPTSGGPPFNAYEVSPTRAFGFPTADQREPTRWSWDT